MELIKNFFDIFMHVDRHLNEIIVHYGFWSYLILFLIIFCETGLVVTPFLPGDSLLFAAGALSTGTSLDVGWVFVLLSIAAIAGNTVNYWIGYYVGPKVFHKKDVPFLNREYLERTHRFYEKHGGKTIIIARFIPIIRTFAPFVAGLGFMTHWRFTVYNISAGMAWVAIFVFGGYFFGNIPYIKHNFSFVILAIIFISILPGIIEILRHRFRTSHTR